MYSELGQDSTFFTALGCEVKADDRLCSTSRAHSRATPSCGFLLLPLIADTVKGSNCGKAGRPLVQRYSDLSRARLRAPLGFTEELIGELGE